jgi:hypothetical protein
MGGRREAEMLPAYRLIRFGRAAQTNAVSARYTSPPTTWARPRPRGASSAATASGAFNYVRAALYVAEVPTGTTGEVVVTMSGSVLHGQRDSQRQDGPLNLDLNTTAGGRPINSEAMVATMNSNLAWRERLLLVLFRLLLPRSWQEARPSSQPTP